MKALEHKIPPPIVAIFFALLIYWLSKQFQPIAMMNDIKNLMAIACLTTGIVFDIAGVIAFRQHQTTINPLKPNKATTLVTHGVYQYTRNPMYVGLAFILLAWTIYLAVPIALLICLAFILFITRFQIRPEERAMQQLFGEQYTAYKKQVRRWL